MQQSVARGMQAAGENPNGGASSMAFMGMGMNAVGGAMSGLQQPVTEPSEDPYTKLTEMKKLLDSGVITQADFDAAKAKLLGL